jgi:glycosyltransferase involved in cell wall biosynthesis
MPPTDPLPLSVVIISLNEEKRIGDCLDSLRGLTEDVVVVDSHSRDATPAICRARGARVWQRGWTGYSAQKNFGIAQARHDWILSLDADERVSAELAAAIREELSSGPRCDAYAIAFENYFGARRIRFGAWNPEQHVRLFDRRVLRWNEDAVHEGLCSEGEPRVGKLRGVIRHLTVDSAAQLAEKTERYSALFAAKVRRRKRPPGALKVWFNPLWRFGRDYLLRLGCLDGPAGAVIAWESARYTHLKYAKALPAGGAARLMAKLTLAASCALIAVNLARMPATNGPGGLQLPPTRVAQADFDEDFSNMNSASFDDDDDVVV